MKSLKYFFTQAEKKGWAIPQFNFSNERILKGIIGGLVKHKSPAILATSEGESRNVGLEQAVALVDSYRKFTKLPLFLHLDHGKSFDYIKKAIEAGYDSVHYDGSNLSLKENIKNAKKVVAYARKRGIPVEGEVGLIGDVKDTKEVTTEPDEAFLFMKETKVDSLGVAVGNLHGINVSGVNPSLRIRRIKAIKEKVRAVPLVLHGGSGVCAKDIKPAIKAGIAKININTELRKAYTDGLRETLKKHPKEIVPYKYMPYVIREVQKVVEEKIKAFGSKNKAKC